MHEYCIITVSENDVDDFVQKDEFEEAVSYAVEKYLSMISNRDDYTTKDIIMIEEKLFEDREVSTPSGIIVIKELY